MVYLCHANTFLNIKHKFTSKTLDLYCVYKEFYITVNILKDLLIYIGIIIQKCSFIHFWGKKVPGYLQKFCPLIHSGCENLLSVHSESNMTRTWRICTAYDIRNYGKTENCPQVHRLLIIFLFSFFSTKLF